jgi:hypothetical protein
MQLVIFEYGRHQPFIEQPQDFSQTLGLFLGSSRRSMAKEIELSALQDRQVQA